MQGTVTSQNFRCFYELPIKIELACKKIIKEYLMHELTIVEAALYGFRILMASRWEKL